MIKDLLYSALRPVELNAMLRLKLGALDIRQFKEPLEEIAANGSDHDFCYAALQKVSRSFAVVIQQLPEELKDPVCIFYLVLRGLDTIEDDMSQETATRIDMLRRFDEITFQDGWNLNGVGDTADYRTLLRHYHKVIAVLKSLKPEYQAVIQEITRKMGNGMADYAELKVNSLADYDQYCHYVAGLVGIGLSGLFSASKLESPMLKNEITLSNSMGLLLQKTNITRDYFEDLSLGRAFWPKEIWGKYTDRLDQLQKDPTSTESLACVNELVTDALKYVEDCVKYLSMLRNEKVFRFCAIPQVMAMATLAKIYNNPDVYTEVVKIRKGLAASLMMYTNDMNSVNKVLAKYTKEILKKLNTLDPNYDLTQARCHLILAELQKHRSAKVSGPGRLNGFFY